MDYQATHFIYVEDITIPGLPVCTLFNYLPSFKAAQKLLEVLLDGNKRYGAYNSGNEIRIMHDGRVIKRWVIEDVKNADKILMPHADKLKLIQGVWTVVSFVAYRGTTYTQNWEAFSVEGYLIKDKTFSTGKWHQGPDGLMVMDKDGDITFEFNQKPKWRVQALMPDKLVLTNMLKSLTYTCKRIKKKRMLKACKIVTNGPIK